VVTLINARLVLKLPLDIDNIHTRCLVIAVQSVSEVGDIVRPASQDVFFGNTKQGNILLKQNISVKTSEVLGRSCPEKLHSSDDL
jgi:hypothetical protein